jgi:hypothetical protein
VIRPQNSTKDLKELEAAFATTWKQSRQPTRPENRKNIASISVDQRFRTDAIPPKSWRICAKGASPSSDGN